MAAALAEPRLGQALGTAARWSKLTSESRPEPFLCAYKECADFTSVGNTNDLISCQLKIKVSMWHDLIFLEWLVLTYSSGNKKNRSSSISSTLLSFWQLGGCLSPRSNSRNCSQKKQFVPSSGVSTDILGYHNVQIPCFEEIWTVWLFHFPAGTYGGPKEATAETRSLSNEALVC